ncbi:MAG TPA: AMP-binding protein, partial [Mycobacterium sp.]|nr:AMP-binding protein [Mycobacterium sp.]
SDVVDMEKINPDLVDLPGWYRSNPGLARDLAFIGFSTISGELVARQITNYRWALSAFGTASAANLGRNDTVYCLTPLHHQSGLLVSLGGAVVGGARVALSRGPRPDRFLQEIRQYGVTVVSYTWAMLRDVIDDPAFSLTGSHSVRLFIGSGMPTGLWRRVVEVFGPAHVVEFFATTDGQAVLANVSGAKIGSKGRPLPGGGEIALAAYDPEDNLILEDDRGFVRLAEANEVGVLLSHPRGPVDPLASVKRGVFAPADTWVSTEYLFRRDEDGDYWQVDNRDAAIHTARGAVFAATVNDAVGRLGAVDMAVTYGVQADGQTIAVTALALRPGGSVPSADLSEALAELPVGNPPDIVHVVPDMTLSATFRPLAGPLQRQGVPKPSRNAWYRDPDTLRYKRLTVAVRSEIVGSQ